MLWRKRGNSARKLCSGDIQFLKLQGTNGPISKFCVVGADPFVLTVLDIIDLHKVSRRDINARFQREHVQRKRVYEPVARNFPCNI